jgi:Xaa-Pro aminopeptidase
MNKLFYQNNRKTFMRNLQSGCIALVFGSSAPYRNGKGYYGKSLDMDFFYLTGMQDSSCILAMWKENGTDREKIFIHPANPDDEKWSGIRLTNEQVEMTCGVQDIDRLDRFDTFLLDMLGNGDIHALSLDIAPWNNLDVALPIHTFISMKSRNYPEVLILNCADTLAGMRLVKQEEEIAEIQKAIENAKNGIEAMMYEVRPGMYEYQLQAIAANWLYMHGEMVASPMVATGGNAVILHYPGSRSQIKENDLVLIDFCPRHNYYASDISRAFPAKGKFSPRQKDIYSIALDANEQMIDIVKPGMTFKEMNERCRQFLGRSMMSIGLIDSQKEVERYYYHGVSHFIGLDIHDVGNNDIPLPENVVLSIDAGVYIKEEGIGLRVEDTVLVTRKGAVNLSHSIKKEVGEIEELMSRA